MKLFRIDWRDGTFYIEAETMERAIAAWRAHMAEDDAYAYEDEDDDPATCALVHGAPVIRRKDLEAR